MSFYKPTFTFEFHYLILRVIEEVKGKLKEQAIFYQMLNIVYIIIYFLPQKTTKVLKCYLFYHLPVESVPTGRAVKDFTKH